MDMTNFPDLAMACAPMVHPMTTQALVQVESGFNPHAIGVVGGILVRQPRSRAEAVSTARALRARGWNFSAGLGQINVTNFERLGLTLNSAFEPCANLGAMQVVLGECFYRAGTGTPSASEQHRLHRALSCYYSGNFTTGFRHGYVQRLVAHAARIPSTTLKRKEAP